MNANWLILAIGLASGALPAWWLTSGHYQGVIAKEHEAQQVLVIEQQRQSMVALSAYIERGKTAGVEHDKNAIIVRDLRRERDRLRIAFPTCPVSDTTETGADSGGGGGILSDQLDAAFADLQRETGILVERCDTLNIDAIRANAIRSP